MSLLARFLSLRQLNGAALDVFNEAQRISPNPNATGGFMSIKRYELGTIFSGAAAHGGIAYLAGLAADDLSQDLRGQTEQTLAYIDRVLAQAGSDKSKLLKVEVWLADMANFDAMNAIYQAWLDPENVPPRVCVESRLWDDAAQVEIMVTAVV
jgi:enamine deaminase RidA (YjgF/YER057c/UK114 family)